MTIIEETLLRVDEDERLRYLTYLVENDYGASYYHDWVVSCQIDSMYFRPWQRSSIAMDVCERMGHNKTMEKTMLCTWCSDDCEYHELKIIATNGRRINDYSLSMNSESLQDYIDSSDVIVLCESCRMVQGYCHDCNTVMCNDDSYTNPDDYSVCNECWENNYDWCGEHEHTYTQGYGCRYCESESSRLIHDYSYTETPKFFLKDGSFSFIEPARQSVTGFELEMEAVNCERETGAETAMELFSNVAYLKYDGSLDDGFELVTHPLSRDYVRNEFNFDGMRELARLGMRSAQTQSCGLHVHINKGFFDGRPSSFYRFMAMFYRNKSQWRRIAGRENSNYASWNEEQEDNMLHYTKGMANNDVYARNADRYVALNLQPRHTIEMRFFKGTLRPQTLKARVEAIHAVAEYSIATRNKVNIKSSSDWELFREFARQNGYISFSDYADEKGV